MPNESNGEKPKVVKTTSVSKRKTRSGEPKKEKVVTKTYGSDLSNKNLLQKKTTVIKRSDGFLGQGASREKEKVKTVTNPRTDKVVSKTKRVKIDNSGMASGKPNIVKEKSMTRDMAFKSPLVSIPANRSVIKKKTKTK